MGKRRFPTVTIDLTVITLALVLLILVPLILPSVYPLRKFEGTLDEKLVKTENGRGVYLFIIERGGKKEVFANKDNLFFLKFNSSDVYANIEEGETYVFTSVGFRVPFLSMYKNIVRVETSWE